jgi:hypothetical protein
MTQDEIIEMARQAGFKMENSAAIQAAEIFANLVAAKKQERIIEMVERLGTWAHITEVVAEIRGQA